MRCPHYWRGQCRGDGRHSGQGNGSQPNGVPGLSTPELYIEANRMACDGIMDEPVNYRMAQRSWEMLRKLESWDVCFPTDEKGEYEVLQVHPKGRFCVTMKEPGGSKSLIAPWRLSFSKPEIRLPEPSA
jgi:succinate dehydrogenase/fumarate reductase flavoprotein subunit